MSDKEYKQPLGIYVVFEPSGRGKAQNPSNPAYPNGVEVEDPDYKGPTCFLKLQYPAPECGYLLIRCEVCLLKVGITAAGRADDPRSVKLPCRLDNLRYISKQV